MAQDFNLPDLGEGITEAQIIKVLVKEGESIAEDQGLFEVETDKAAVEIPSPYSGVATKVHVAEGQTVNVGDVMISFDSNGSATAEKPAPAAKAPEKKTEAPPASAPTPGSAPVAAGTAKKTTAPAAPAVRKLARERGVDIDTLRGSGPGGRVTREDVEGAASGGAGPARAPAVAPAASPVVPDTTIAPPPGVADTDKWGSVRRAPLSQIRKTIANQMVKSAFTVPHVTHIDQADISDLEKARRSYNESTGSRVTAMAFLIRVVATSLKRHPVFNATLDMDKGEIVYKEYVNIGIAVDTDRGLVVPNIRNADRMSVTQIGAALAGIAESARNVQFAIEDLRGGTFTLTNVGALGGMFSTPIINVPEVAILGIGRAKDTAVVRDGEIVVRTMMPLSLSFDHRIADGAQAARFCGDVIRYLENPVSLLF